MALRSTYAAGTKTPFYDGVTNVVTTLAEDLTDTEALTVVITDGTGIKPSGIFLVDDEIIYYDTGALDRVSELTRGYAGTTPASHSSGATVTFYIEPPYAFTNQAVTKVLDDLQDRLGVVKTSPSAAKVGLGLVVSEEGKCDWREQNPVRQANIDYTLLEADRDAIFNNLGATGSVTLTLPPIAPSLIFTFVVCAAFDLIIQVAGTETIRIAGNVSAAGQYASSSTVGDSLMLASAGSEWMAIGGINYANWALA